ncbi:DoxX family protein [Streptomyces sp. NPDC058420]|uniref:DoxX family protein n=1 Tax=Streptomyces sp. NPDC058420 TaxID=3346489 RepID=UPI0036493186
MAVHEYPHRTSGFHLPRSRRNGSASDGGVTAAATATTATRAYAFASLRLLTGFVFLWAFLDKTFGLGYATPSGKGWVDGGSPTKGFLSSVAAGPMASTFHDWAGAGWVNWLFMLGLLGVGVALVSGVALRLAAVAGTAMMAFMWLAEWPPAKHLSDGTPSMSSNPFADYHLIYAVVLIALAVAGAGVTWGLGKVWAELPIIRDHTWLR